MTLFRKFAKEHLPTRLVRALETPLSFEQQFEIRLRELTNRVAIASNMTVQSGLFAGMKLTDYWGPLGAKLLGVYECELADVIEKAVLTIPDVIINIGCAEGYYSVGLARLLPAAAVYAYDMNDSAQDRCYELALENGVAERVCIGGQCTNQTIQHLLQTANDPLLVIDCEGAEKEILLVDEIEIFSRSTIVVECHDFMDRTITSRLVEAFSKTHFVKLIQQNSRNPHSMPLLKDWPESHRWMVIMEGRGEPMHWLSMVPKRI
jgi:hypothetical protein